MYIFLDKSNNIWLDKYFLEVFWSKPFISDKSFFLSRSWLVFSLVFDEKEVDVLVDHRRAFHIGGDERVVDLVHEFDDLKISYSESSLFRYFSEGSLHSGLILFDMPLGEDIFSISSSIFPGEHEDVDFGSSFSIDNTTSALFMEFCHDS
jgi:hypothetical protein